MPNENKPISIKQFQTGLAESPYQGFAELRGMDVTTHPGALLLSPKLSSSNSTATTGTFTADPATDILTGPQLVITVFGSGYFGIRTAYFTTTGSLPAGLSTNTYYWLTTSGGTSTYKVSTSLANANASTFVDITTAGSGVHTLTTVDPGYLTKIASDGAGSNVYGVDNNGRVWQLNSTLWYMVGGNTLEHGNNVTTNNGLGGQGAEIYKNYLFIYRTSAIDVMNITTQAWTNAWQSTHANSFLYPHRTLVGQDDIQYFGDNDGSNNNYIGSIQQVVGQVFDPTNGATYTYTNAALTLPQYKTVTDLSELGVNLMIGTSGREIYPWDRTSASFGLPIVCPEVYVYRMRNVGNQLYIAAGNRGNLYLYNGYLAAPKKIFPKHLLTQDGASCTVGDMTTVGRKLIFTIQTVSNSGVFSLDIVTGAMSMENITSTGYIGTSNAIVMPALFSTNGYYFVSWYDNDHNTSAIDVSADTGTSRYPDSANYSAGMKNYVVTPILDVGYYNVPRDFQYIEVYLDRPLVNGSSIYVHYRTSANASFTLLGTFTGDNATQAFQCNAGSISSTDLQVKVEMVGTSSVSPYLQEVRII